MAIGTKDTVVDRKALIADLRKKHETLFEKEGVGTKARFIPKMAYIPRSGEEKVIAFFPSEINKGVDVYTEFVSSEYESEDPERRLWKWLYNPEFDTEYQKTDPHEATGHHRYLVPVQELIDVAQVHGTSSNEKPPVPEPQQQELEFNDLPDADDDSPMEAMTMKDHIAIEKWIPVSRKKWLNELIKKNPDGGN